jgi:hypothetical protein
MPMNKPTDIEIVKGILDRLEGSTNQQKSDEIVKVLGKRIRQRARDRRNAESREDVNQAAFRIVRESTTH